MQLSYSTDRKKKNCANRCRIIWNHLAVSMQIFAAFRAICSFYAFIFPFNGTHASSEKKKKKKFNDVLKLLK